MPYGLRYNTSILIETNAINLSTLGKGHFTLSCIELDIKGDFDD